MSVQVEIDIAPSGFRTRRHLEINRIQEGENGRHGYEVFLSGGGHGRSMPLPRARFEHNYDDDVLALITEAITALRERGLDRV